MRKLINKVATRRFILQVANENIPSAPTEYTDSTGRTWDYTRAAANMKKFTSVGQDYIDRLDADLRKMIVDRIKAEPPRGKTVK